MTVPHTQATDTVLDVNHLELSYQSAPAPRRTVLRNFSMQVRAGEVIALLGPSGVGKSSLLRVLAGLQPVEQGIVRLHGQKVTGPHPRLGFVFQSPNLLPWLTVEQNVGFGLDFRHQPAISPSGKSQRVTQALQEVGLLQAKSLYPNELSGGMAQRAALARCLAREPEIMLLDEPFSALDEVTRQEMQELLLQLTQRHHAAAIIVTHDIDEALLVADRVLLLGDNPGRLIGEWPVMQPHPRDDAVDALAALRMEIVHAMRATRKSGAPSKPH